MLFQRILCLFTTVIFKLAEMDMLLYCTHAVVQHPTQSRLTVRFYCINIKNLHVQLLKNIAEETPADSNIVLASASKKTNISGEITINQPTYPSRVYLNMQ